MKLCERIKALRLDMSLTQKDISTRIGVTEVSVSCWEKGTKSPSMNAIVSLSSLFGVSTDYLLGVANNTERDAALLNKQEFVLLSNYRVLDKHGKRAVETICQIEKTRVDSEFSVLSKTNIVYDKKSPSRYIPRYSTPSAAGCSVPLDGDDFEMILVDDSIPSDADFAVEIQGNSMYPYIRDGDTVYVKKDCDLSVGDIGIFCVDGAVYCKQYYIDADKNITLVSANPKLKKTNIYLSSEGSSEFRCYGKVILECTVELPSYLSDLPIAKI